MAAPTIQAEGTTATGVTSGVPSVTIPTHQANDIIVIVAMAWVPNTTTPDAAQIPTPTNVAYALIGSQVGQPAGSPRDGWVAAFWFRATGAGTTVTLTRGSGWDTGTDTCYNARAYIIRGCRQSGNPYESTTSAGPHTAANQTFPAITVSGSGRTVIHFGGVSDNLGFALTSSGWSTGTAGPDNGGTDSNFNIAYKSNVSSNTSADTTTAAAPVAGAYGFIGASFVPTADNSISGAVTVTATPSSTTAKNQNPTIAGAVTVTATPSAVMEYSSSGNHYVIAGAVTVTVTPSSVTEKTQHPEIAGAVTVTAIPTSVTVKNKNPVLAGSITVTAIPSSTTIKNSHPVIAGFITVVSILTSITQFISGSFSGASRRPSVFWYFRRQRR